jgi:hypothetical protein
MGHNPRGGLLKLLLVRIEQDVRKAVGLGVKATTDKSRDSKMKALILQYSKCEKMTKDTLDRESTCTR